MSKLWRKFLSKVLLGITAFVLFIPSGFAATNLPSYGGVGDFGSWATEDNRNLFIQDLSRDVGAFQAPFQEHIQNNLLVSNYVPIEARVGRAFIGAFTLIGEVLERSLVRFVSIFIIIMFIFWILFEAYQMMTQTSKATELVEDIIKKAVLISVWILIIEQGPAQLFMWIVTPIISISSYLSDLILNSVSTAAGASLPDTCVAIHQYMANNPSNFAIIDSAQAADLLCVPTRLSGFFYTGVAAGWKWMMAGIGSSPFTFFAGVTFVVLFLYNIWKFALIALGVIADLFLTVMLLPFTAIAETIGQNKLSYKGPAAELYNGFMKLFSTQSLQSQIMKFVNAALYFVSLSIVVALCAAILSGVVRTDLAATVPSLDNDGFMIVLIVGCLVAYLANKASKLAGDIAGSIDDSFGTQFGGDMKKVWGNTTKTVQSWWKAARKK